MTKPTMYVEVDGEIDEREIDHVEAHPVDVCGRSIKGVTGRTCPVLLDGEQAVWEIGKSIPRIIKLPASPHIPETVNEQNHD